jgi:hypothetical protein
MKYSRDSVAVDFHCTKEASLYFENVIPIDPLFVFKELRGESSRAPDARIWPSDVPEWLGDVVAPLLPDGEMLPDYLRYCNLCLAKTNDAEAKKDFWTQFAILFAKFRLDNYPVISRSTEKIGEPHRANAPPGPAESESQKESVGISLCKLNLIDVSKARWEHILEFREDAESTRKLRNLRLFLSENYTGKELEYIKDDLCRRLDEYEEVRKGWAFETKTAVLSAFFSSKSLTAAAGGTLLSALLGSTATAAVTATTGVFMEVGKAAIEVHKRKHDLDCLTNRHPLSYVISANDRINC